MNNTHIFLCDIHFYCDKNTDFLYLHSTRRLMSCILQSHKCNCNFFRRLLFSLKLWRGKTIFSFFSSFFFLLSSLLPLLLSFLLSHTYPFLLFWFWTSHWYNRILKLVYFLSTIFELRRNHDTLLFIWTPIYLTKAYYFCF